MVRQDPPLPALATDLTLEIHFRRLLASCEDIAMGDHKGREDLKSWQVSPAFHQVRKRKQAGAVHFGLVLHLLLKV